MKKYNFAILVIAGMAFLATCNTTADKKDQPTMETQTFDLSAARKWIEADNAKFAEEVKRGDSDAVAAHYASDGMAMMDNSEPKKGKDIAATWGMVSRMGVKDIKITTTDLVGNAELLAETGTYELYGEGNKLLDKGKYVVVWKQENGNWKIYRDIGNSSLPEPSPTSKK